MQYQSKYWDMNRYNEITALVFFLLHSINCDLFKILCHFLLVTVEGRKYQGECVCSSLFFAVTFTLVIEGNYKRGKYLKLQRVSPNPIVKNQCSKNYSDIILE